MYCVMMTEQFNKRSHLLLGRADMHNNGGTAGDCVFFEDRDEVVC
jgi:hypothetical protein